MRGAILTLTRYPAVMTPKKPTIEQLRARHAWAVVANVKRRSNDEQQGFARDVKRLPVRIHTAGLGQAIGFLRAKSSGNDYRTLLLTKLGEWLLLNRNLFRDGPQSVQSDSLLRAIVDGNSESLMRATDEAMRYLQWLSRFCEAEIKSDD